MKKHWIKLCWSLLIGIFLTIENTAAQQLAQLTQSRFNQLSYNAAYAGSKKGINVESAIRGQWLGIKGTPFTQTLHIHAPAPLLRSGVGLSLFNDFAGVQRTTALYMSYAYRQPVNQKITAAIGIQAGILQQSLRGDDLISPDGEYISGGINHNDNFIPVGKVAAVTPDLNVGIYICSKKFELGLATQHLLQPQLEMATETDVVTINIERSYTANAAYWWQIDKLWTLSPSIFWQSDLLIHQVSGNILATYDDFLQFGASFRGVSKRSLDSAGLMAGIYIGNRWFLSYSYDFPLSTIRQGSTGSHELVIHYNLTDVLSVKEKKVIYNPRFL